MTEAIIAALVAAIVSVIGIIVNMYIAWKARESAYVTLRHGSVLKEKETILNTLRSFAAKVEQLRLSSFQLGAQLNTAHMKLKYKNSINQMDRDETIKGITSAKDDFYAQHVEFLKAWSEGRVDLPPESSALFNAILHDSKNAVDGLDDYLGVLGEPTSNLDDPEVLEHCAEIVRRQTWLMDGFLEQLYFTTLKVRNDLMEELLSNKETVGRVE